MKAILFLCEGGYLILSDPATPVLVHRFENPSEDYGAALRGQELGPMIDLLKQARAEGFTSIIAEPNLASRIPADIGTVEEGENPLFENLRAKKMELMVKSGLVSSDEEARELTRKVAMAAAEQRIRVMSSNLDLQVIQAIQALDEVEKMVNGLTSRVREWYGLHFPELSSLVQDSAPYLRIASIGDRNRLNDGALHEATIPKEKADKILKAATDSKGGDIRVEDLAAIQPVAQEALHLHTVRGRLTAHVESTMEKVAPNVTSIAGAAVGARLIAKTGSLSRLAQLPASTIQVLGAEKALFRALKTGARPPKHGILFQHSAVRSAPKRDRGRVARLIAGKIAIAARIDAYRGGTEAALGDALKRRLEEISRRQPRRKNDAGSDRDGGRRRR